MSNSTNPVSSIPSTNNNISDNTPSSSSDRNDIKDHQQEQQNTTPQRHHTPKHRHKNYHHHNSPPPTNCIVLKNLDYNISIEDLEEVVRRVTSGRNEFQSITPVEDKHTGSFRGMAFVNFYTVADATAALKELSKMVINGRKVITEYRRLRPNERKDNDRRGKKSDHDRRYSFFNDRRAGNNDHRFEERSERDLEREAEFRALLVNYRKGDLDLDSEVKDLVFDCSLTSYERRMVHLICGELELGHISRFDDNQNRVLHVTKDPQRTREWEKEAEEERAQQQLQQPQNLPPKRIQKKKKDKENMDLDSKNGAGATKEEHTGLNYFKPKCAQSEAGNSGEIGANALGIRAPSYKTFVPKRQPTGPDGTSGFASRIEYAAKQQGSENGHSAENDAEIVATGTAAISLNESEQKEVDADPKEMKPAKKNGKGSHTVLNPSVPAFSPSFTPTY